MTGDPIARFKELLVQAEQRGMQPHNAAALATAGDDRQATVRMVLLKGVDDAGFVFYTIWRAARRVSSPKARTLRFAFGGRS